MSKRGKIPDQVSWFCKYNGTNFYRLLDEKLLENNYKLDRIISTISGYSNKYNLIVHGLCVQDDIKYAFTAYFVPANTSNPKETIYKFDNLIIERR